MLWIMSRIKCRFYIDNILIKRRFSESTEKIQVLKTDAPSIKSKRDYTQPKFWTLFRSTPQHVDQSSANIFLFPGHGSHFVGMANALIKLPQVQRLFESASQYLNYNLLKVCIEGPSKKLDKLIHSHPAIYVASLAALEKVKHEQPEVGLITGNEFPHTSYPVNRELHRYCRTRCRRDCVFGVRWSFIIRCRLISVCVRR